MRNKLLLLLCLLGLGCWPAHAEPTVFDLVGHWRTVVEFGKMKFNLVLKIEKLPDGKVGAKVDVPEQGAKDIAVNALLFNFPAVRLEIDPFNTAFNGKVNEGKTELAGAFEEGPGGRPLPVTFKRLAPGELEGPKLIFGFNSGEPRDIRGYWDGMVDAPPDGKAHIGLKIGKAPDGTYRAMLDMLDRGATDLPATSVTYSNSVAELKWQLFETTFTAELGQEAKELAGEWKSSNRKSKVAFKRLDKPASALPENVSYEAKADSSEDIRGTWTGALTVPGGKLRLIFKIGQTPEGAFAGTLTSPDQGPQQIPISSVGYTNPVVRLEWKAIHGVYTGNVSPDGATLNGHWEQGGPPMELKLTRRLDGKEKQP